MYDLTVEGAESFTVGGAAVHNCYGRLNDMHGAVGHYLLLPSSIDNEIMDLLSEKRTVTDAINAGKGERAQVSVLGDLLVRLARKGMAA